MLRKEIVDFFFLVVEYICGVLIVNIMINYCLFLLFFSFVTYVISNHT